MADPFSCRDCGKFLFGDQEFVCSDCAAKPPPAHLAPSSAEGWTNAPGNGTQPPPPQRPSNKPPWKMIAAIGAGALVLLFGTGYLLAGQDLNAAKANSGNVKINKALLPWHVCDAPNTIFEGSAPYEKTAGIHGVMFDQEKYADAYQGGGYTGELPAGWEVKDNLAEPELMLCNKLIAQDAIACNGFQVVTGEFELRLLEVRTGKELARTSIPSSAAGCPAKDIYVKNSSDGHRKYADHLEKEKVIEFVRPFVDVA